MCVFCKEQGILKFRMTKPGSLAFFQRNSLHFPFLSWQLISDGKNRAKFFVRTELMKLNFEIKVWMRDSRERRFKFLKRRSFIE